MKKLLFTFFLFSHLSLYAQTVNVTASGTIGVSCSEYVNNMNKIWNIDIPGNRKLVLNYSVRVERSYDKVSVYSINDSGAAVLQATLTGSQSGTIESLYPNGKMRIVFTSDYSVNCNTNSTYGGFTIIISQLAPRGISYSYDGSGNRTDRVIVFESGSALRSSTFQDDGEEIVFQEKINYLTGDELSEADIRIYPNPTQGQLAVEINNISGEASGEIYLYDAGGKIIERRAFGVERKIDFDLSRQVAGIYILKINIEGKISTWKIIKK
jgi:antitoxin component YwqK of YwqJK toxin-antitoxin module